MAYLDKKPATNRRALTALAVAVLQAGAIIAVIHGLTVHIVPNKPEPPLVGQQIDLPPPPPPPDTKPKIEPKPNDIRITNPQPRIEVPPTSGSVFELPLPPLPPVSPPQIEPPVPPPAPPTFTPRFAQPRNDPGNWVTTNDYPSRDLREGNQGLARFLLTIGTNGKVEACTITQSTGFRGLDEATCKYVSRRASFKPATDGNGAKVAGSYAGSVRWLIPER